MIGGPLADVQACGVQYDEVFGKAAERALLLRSVDEKKAVDDDKGKLIDIAKPRYDLNTYSGRLSHFYSVTSPLTLLYSTTSLKEAEAHVVDVEARLPSSRDGTYLVTPAEAERYWRAKQLVQSSVHPETGEVIPLPFRMSAFVPTNLIILAGMLRPTNGVAATIFWQWINQSLNVAVNYSNANKSVPMDMKEVGTAYVGATGAAVALAVGLTKIVTPGTLLARLVPFASVASAGCVNVSLMRWKEIRDGVSVFRTDDDGKRTKVGESPIAGRTAVGMTAASRVMTNIPTMLVPPILMSVLQRRRILPKSGRLTQAVDMAMIGTSLLLCLPPAIAYFPQTGTIAPSKLEPRFHDLKDEQGRPVEKLEFNKGL